MARWRVDPPPLPARLGFRFTPRSVSQVYAAVKQFGRASELLTQALVAPAPVLNAIQLASYKKLVRPTRVEPPASRARI